MSNNNHVFIITLIVLFSQNCGMRITKQIQQPENCDCISLKSAVVSSLKIDTTANAIMCYETDSLISVATTPISSPEHLVDGGGVVFVWIKSSCRLYKSEFSQ